MRDTTFTVNIEATVIGMVSKEAALDYLMRLALRDKKVCSAGMTDDDLNESEVK